MEEIIILVKLQKMWTTSAFDPLIISKIEAAVRDLQSIGITGSYQTDPLIREAVVTYCVMNLGKIEPNEYDRLKRCEANLKALGLNPWITIGEADKRMHREARILINRMESAKSRIESAMHELKHLKNQLDDLAKIPEEQEEREPIKINEEHEENQSEGRPAT